DVRESAAAAGASGTPGAPDRPRRPSAPAPAPAPGGRATASVPEDEEAPSLADLPLYRHPRTQVLDWIRGHPGDPRRPVIASRIGDRPTALWFASYDPGTIRSRVRAVTSAAEALGHVPVLVPYAIPGRDCGGASRGGAPDLTAYDRWTGEFAAGLGSGHVLVVLEPDSLAQAGCLPEHERAARLASLARAARAMKAANPKARVYFDAGSSGWHPPARTAETLRAVGAVRHGDGIFTNVSQYHRTADEVAYARRVLTALGAPPRFGAVIDTGRNGNGAPNVPRWCDPPGRAIGQPPTTGTGAARIHAYLWVKPPGESDGCRGAPGAFTPDYAHELATG
ncbi:glycoside hydrolase family 6 protein, partial [Streptomyces sp. TRM64462]|uniref:glycoside hydrolase family 6 protein n=1 Tax=Streptomyces sp. TRM64462 TaxID=2741726 RepID=UPI001586E8A1